MQDTSRRCECGMPTKSQSGCERCQYLDGGRLLRYIDSMYVELVWAAICIGLAAIICTFVLIGWWFQ